MYKFIIFLALLWQSAAIAQVFTSFPPNMYADSTAYPFYWGIASGDPLSDRVILWTKAEKTDDDLSPIPLTWEISSDSTFSTIINNGTIMATIEKDWTAKVDADNLQAYTTYYYRFTDTEGNSSRIGRTKTAPSGSIDELKFAVASCSSIFSGYFNAYRRIGERNDIDLFIHVGDYVYDFVDGDERVRIPEPEPTEPFTLQEWHWRHAYYLLDPDLRYARQQHPMIAMWDNHDIELNNISESVQAFRNYLPMRDTPGEAIEKAYQKLQYGDLVDIFVSDVLLYKNIDSLAVGEYSMLGNEQYEWLTEGLLNSTAKWRFITSQNMMSLWNAEGLPPLPGLTDGPVFDPSSWDGHFLEREMLLNFIKDNTIDNCMVLSGDAHMSFIMDLPIYPLDSLQYIPSTGEGSVAVEFLPTSITRGNFDEQGIPENIALNVAIILLSINPHHIFMQPVKHGYGTLTVRADSTVAKFWYSPILSLSDTEELGAAFVVQDGANHWQRNAIDGLILGEAPINQAKEQASISLLEIIPNPSDGIFSVSYSSRKEQQIAIELLNSKGQFVRQLQANYPLNSTTKTQQFDLSDLPSGIYLLCIKSDKEMVLQKIILK